MDRIFLAVEDGIGWIGASAIGIAGAVLGFIPKLLDWLKGLKEINLKAQDDKAARDWSNQTAMLNRLTDEINEFKIDLKLARDENRKCEDKSAMLQSRVAVLEATNVAQEHEIEELRTRIKDLENMLGKR